MFSLASGIMLPELDLGFVSLGIGECFLLVFIGLPTLFFCGLGLAALCDERARRRHAAYWNGEKTR